MNWLDAEVKRSKVKGQGKTKYGQISTLGDILSPISGMHQCTSLTLITITHYHIHRTVMTLQGHGVKGRCNWYVYNSDHSAVSCSQTCSTVMYTTACVESTTSRLPSCAADDNNNNKYDACKPINDTNTTYSSASVDSVKLYMLVLHCQLVQCLTELRVQRATYTLWSVLQTHVTNMHVDRAASAYTLWSVLQTHVTNMHVDRAASAYTLWSVLQTHVTNMHVDRAASHTACGQYCRHMWQTCM